MILMAVKLLRYRAAGREGDREQERRDRQAEEPVEQHPSLALRAERPKRHHRVPSVHAAIDRKDAAQGGDQTLGIEVPVGLAVRLIQVLAP